MALIITVLLCSGLNEIRLNFRAPKKVVICDIKYLYALKNKRG